RIEIVEEARRAPPAPSGDLQRSAAVADRAAVERRDARAVAELAAGAHPHLGRRALVGESVDLGISGAHVVAGAVVATGGVVPRQIRGREQRRLRARIL